MSSRAGVVVIGAGMAGLTAAHRLVQAGFDVTDLEAAERPGGRIHTESVPYGYLENGGIFHTQQYPAFRALIAEIGLADKVTTVPTDSTPACSPTAVGSTSTTAA